MANVYPKEIQFLIADHVRQEEGGKLSLLGFYSGDAVLLKGPLPAEIPEGVGGIALPGLTIVAVVRDGQGSFDSTFHLYSPDGRELGQGVKGQKLDKAKGGAASLIVPIQPFPIPEFGIYRARLQLGKHEYEFQFKVGHFDPNVPFPPKVSKGDKSAPSEGKALRGKVSAEKRNPRKRAGTPARNAGRASAAKG